MFMLQPSGTLKIYSTGLLHVTVEKKTIVSLIYFIFFVLLCYVLLHFFVYIVLYC